MKENLSVGTVVKYSKPLNDEEKSYRFILRGVYGNRVDIEWICDWRIKPINCVSIDEIEAA